MSIRFFHIARVLAMSLVAVSLVLFVPTSHAHGAEAKSGATAAAHYHHDAGGHHGHDAPDSAKACCHSHMTGCSSLNFLSTEPSALDHESSTHRYDGRTSHLIGRKTQPSDRPPRLPA